jgi:hypothetical protein
MARPQCDTPLVLTLLAATFYKRNLNWKNLDKKRNKKNERMRKWNDILMLAITRIIYIYIYITWFLYLTLLGSQNNRRVLHSRYYVPWLWPNLAKIFTFGWSSLWLHRQIHNLILCVCVCVRTHMCNNLMLLLN